ncbi:MAG: DnaD domain protein [Clostridia bacterium]
MSISKLILDSNDFCVLKGEIVDKILLTANPDVAILYLYMTRNKEDISEKSVLKNLNFSKERYDLAIYDLLSMQILKREAEDTKPISTLKKPNYTIAEINEARKDNKFEAVCITCEQTINKRLTTGYIKTMLYLYSGLKLPAEVIIELLAYIKSKSLDIPTTKDIEREATNWVDMGIASYSEATNYIASKLTEKPLIEDMMHALKKFDRKLQENEEDYIIKFISYGFKPDAVVLAVDKMYRSINRFSYSYLNKILINLKDQNLLTAEDILSDDEKLEKKDRHIKPQSQRTGELEPWEIEMMKELHKE